MGIDNYQNDELLYALDSLESITNRLKILSQMLIMTTLINLVLSMMLMSGMWRAFSSPVEGLTASVIPVICGIYAIMMAFKFDVLRRDGDAFFEELSDELHGKKLRSNENVKETDVSLKARVIIRRYSSAASLPLFPGAYGPTMVAVINIMFSFLGAFMSARYF